jgi:hypothetical protein
MSIRSRDRFASCSRHGQGEECWRQGQEHSTPGYRRKNIWYSGWGSSCATRARPMAMTPAITTAIRDADADAARY